MFKLFHPKGHIKCPKFSKFRSLRYIQNCLAKDNSDSNVADIIKI